LHDAFTVVIGATCILLHHPKQATLDGEAGGIIMQSDKILHFDDSNVIECHICVIEMPKSASHIAISSSSVMS